MIKYTLKCAAGHSFESWFANAEAFDGLKAAGHVSCALCGSVDVDKAIMAPRVSTARATEQAPANDDTGLSEPSSDVETALAQMREAVEKNATYVGGNFASEALAQHLGEQPDRPIWGEANREQAKQLIEDGVPVAPLPFVPSRKAN
ncbi:hypothetical protein GCM10007385_16270 [Tateyamaria omphalii]|uniref:DUF1178 family protein n=1 Tax=Tateyamaria omphalii TaxID=299262 RepID=UPI001671E02A|nr:DUF1178 family protein [Tateyamaria omphalii]GGX48888.1 hypothetical protein GCM10007385_16270 [Tateyamaria omphalii]